MYQVEKYNSWWYNQIQYVPFSHSTWWQDIDYLEKMEWRKTSTNNMLPRSLLHQNLRCVCYEKKERARDKSRGSGKKVNQEYNDRQCTIWVLRTWWHEDLINTVQDPVRGHHIRKDDFGPRRIGIVIDHNRTTIVNIDQNTVPILHIDFLIVV